MTQEGKSCAYDLHVALPPMGKTMNFGKCDVLLMNTNSPHWDRLILHFLQLMNIYHSTHEEKFGNIFREL